MHFQGHYVYWNYAVDYYIYQIKLYQRNKQNNNDNNDNIINVDDEQIDDEMLEEEAKKDPHHPLNTFNQDKFEEYLIDIKKMTRDEIKKIILKTYCGECLECDRPSSFKSSFKVDLHDSTSKSEIYRHWDGKHPHIVEWSKYVF